MKPLVYGTRIRTTVSFGIQPPTDNALWRQAKNLRVNAWPDLLPACRKGLDSSSNLNAAHLPGIHGCNVIDDNGNLGIALYITPFLALCEAAMPTNVK